MIKLKFPKDFIWGAATSAYQIEGAVNEEGRGKCIWDEINHDENGNATGDTGDIACDHYHRYKEDIAIMKDLGLKSYRFSISWTRIFPKGLGEVNSLGVLFYNNLIDELIKNGIEPIVTTWHGDIPLGFEKNASWGNKELIEHYVNYVTFLFDCFGDRVKKWITHNEPWCAAFLGIDNFSESLQRTHNLMVAHAKAVKAYRESKNGDGEIGITLNLSPQYPSSLKKHDIAAANRVDGFINRWFLDIVLKGKYPENMMKLYKSKGQSFNIEEKDMNIISGNICDFLGINYYTRAVLEHIEDNSVLQSQNVKVQEATYTEMGWEVYPKGLYDILIKIKEEYNNPQIYITENGAAFKDEFIYNGLVIDEDRLKYLKDHLSELYNAIEKGVNVKGYYVWSLLDNFEWGLGYSKRFGIIRVDYDNLERTYKKSALWYKSIIFNNGF